MRKRNQKHRDDIKVKTKKDSKFIEAIWKKESERKRVQYIKRKREASLNEKRILNTKEESNGEKHCRVREKGDFARKRIIKRMKEGKQIKLRKKWTDYELPYSDHKTPVWSQMIIPIQSKSQKAKEQ